MGISLNPNVKMYRGPLGEQSIQFKCTLQDSHIAQYRDIVENDSKDHAKEIVKEMFRQFNDHVYGDIDAYLFNITAAVAEWHDDSQAQWRHKSRALCLIDELRKHIEPPEPNPTIVAFIAEEFKKVQEEHKERTEPKMSVLPPEDWRNGIV